MIRIKISKSHEEEEIMAEEIEEEIELNNPKIFYQKLIRNNKKIIRKIIINQERGWTMLKNKQKLKRDNNPLQEEVEA